MEKCLFLFLPLLYDIQILEEFPDQCDKKYVICMIVKELVISRLIANSLLMMTSDQRLVVI